MDKFLFQEIDKITPKFNPDIADGLSYVQMMGTNPDTGTNNTRAYVDKLFEINQSLFPEGFKYLGNRVCTPDQQFHEFTREYGNRRIGNIAKFDTYMIELRFSFNGEELEPRRVLLPFCREGNLCTLNGAVYSISPVLSDVGFTVLNGAILIPFGRTKLMFRQVDHHFYVNGKREVMYVTWSQIHNEMSKRKKADLDNRIKIESCLAHYFFCQFGLIETFKKWAKADVTITYNYNLKDLEKTHNIYESVTLKDNHPSGEIGFAVPKNQDSDLVKRLMAGVFYVMDVFPDRFNDPEHISDKKLWQIVLGFMIFGDFEHQGKVMENIESHLESFNKYLDDVTREELRMVGAKVNDIWELLHYILNDMTHHFYDTDVDETTMYGKRLSVLKFVMSEFNYAVSMFAYSLQSRRDKPWTIKDLTDQLRRSFKLQTCVGRLSYQHGEFEIVSFPGDCKPIKITSILVPQDKARTVKTKNRSLIDDSSRLIHASIAEVGQYKNQPKNNPDGRGRLNPYLNISHDGMVERNPKFKELIDKTQKKLRD